MWIVDYYRRCEGRKSMPLESVMIMIRIFSERGVGDYLIDEIIPQYSEDDEDLKYSVSLYHGYECRRFHSKDAAVIAYVMAREQFYSARIMEEPEDDEEIDSIRCAACRDR